MRYKIYTKDAKEEVRKDYVVILKKARPPKDNLRRGEREALKNIRNNEDIVVLKADKGGATVLLNNKDYVSKMLDHLSSSRSYKQLGSNPISKILREVKKVIKTSSLDDKTKNLLMPIGEITPRIYGLPKIHKEGVPQLMSSQNL